MLFPIAIGIEKAWGHGHEKPDMYRLAIDDILPAMGSKKSISKKPFK